MDISPFGTVLLFFVGSLSFLLITLFVGQLLRPVRPNEEKNATYESGEEPLKTAWNLFNNRFYLVALVFLLFETELVFLFPWAVVFADETLIAESEGLWGKFVLIETFIFIGILTLGLAYIWKNGMLEWARPNQNPSDFKSEIPDSAYSKFK